MLPLLLIRLHEDLGEAQCLVLFDPNSQLIDKGRFLVSVVLCIVQVLAPVPVRTVVLFGELFAQFGPVVQVDVRLLAQFLVPVGERTLRISFYEFLPYLPTDIFLSVRSFCKFQAFISA